MSDTTLADALSARIKGKALEGDTAGEASAPWNLAFAHDPVLVAIPVDAEDVCEVVRFATEHGLPIGVQSTGHGFTTTVDRGVLILTRELLELSVDPSSRTVRFGAGLSWGPIVAATQQHGLTPLLGSAPHVGATGYTLGGGMGWLARKHGLASESVRAIEVVTADGVLRRATESENADLFWALRGGGAGSLGVVTAMEVGLIELTEVYAGNLLYAAEDAAEVTAMFAAWAEDLPDEMTAAIVYMNFPPFDTVPEPIRGTSFTMIRGCWCGPLAEGAALVDRLRAQKAPVMDMFGPLPWTESARISEDPVDPVPGLSLTDSLRSLGPEEAEILIGATFADGGPPPMLFNEIRVGGGALSRGGEGAAAASLAEAPFVIHGVGIADPEGRQALEQHIVATRSALARHTTGTSYVNFLTGPERAARTAEWFGAEEWRRLQQVKRSVDPGGVFRFGLALS